MENLPSTLTEPLNDGKVLANSLISIFERRYLSEFKYRQWFFSEDEEEGTSILLKKIEEIGRIQERDEIRTVMPNILHACHDQGHSLMMLLNGRGNFQEVYLGGKRQIGKANQSTASYMKNIESSFKSYYGGLKMGKAQRMDEISHLTSFLSSAPAMTIITGIPSNKEAAKTFHIQSLDRLARAAGNTNYTVMTIAEPISAIEVDRIVDRLRDMKSEIAALKTQNISRTEGHTKGEAISKQNTNVSKQAYLRSISQIGGLLATASFYIARLSLPLGLVGGIVGGGLSLFGGSKLMQEQANNTTTNLSTSTSTSTATSLTLFNAHAEYCEKLIDEHIKRLISAKSNGWWQMGVYIAAENEEVLAGLIGAIKSLCSGDNSSLDPIRAVNVPTYLLRKNIMEGKLIKGFPIAGENSTIGHPLGSTYDSLSTCVNSTELATIIHLPLNEIPGIRFKHHAEFSLNPPKRREADQVLPIGTIYRDETLLSDVTLKLSSLNRHLFITGMTGGGKSNTSMQILYELYVRHNVPFLIIDPVKADYNNFLSLKELENKFKIFTVGVNADLPLKMNPFELLSWRIIKNNPNFLSKHIELLKSVFIASFPDIKGGPLGLILEDAITRTYKNRGWDISKSRNKFLNLNPSNDEWYAVMPTLEDLLLAVEQVMAEKQYEGEVLSNLKEALITRTKGLTLGNKGAVFNCRRSTKLDDLFEQPVLVEIKDLGDDNDKALVMALLFTFLYEYAECKRGENEQLKHITLVEEAHRLLSSSDSNIHSDIGNPRAKAVEMFIQMIAEMRAYGEGFMIADQSPSALNANTIKNTNIKIIHRLADSQDRALAGGAMNLTQPQIEYLNNLKPGMAVVHDDSFEEPLLIKIFNFKEGRFLKRNDEEKKYYMKRMAENAKRESKEYLFRYSACKNCDNPCSYYFGSEFEKFKSEYRIDRKKFVNELNLISKYADFMVLGEYENAYQSLKKWQKTLKHQEIGTIFCRALHLLDSWAETWLIDWHSDQEYEVDLVLKDKFQSLLAAPLIEFLKTETMDILSKINQNSFEQFFKQYFPEPEVVKSKCNSCTQKCKLNGYIKKVANKKEVITYLELPKEMRKTAVIEKIIPFNEKNNISAWLYCLETNFDK